MKTKLTIKNETQYGIEFVSGAKEEHVLDPGQSVEIEVEDGDIMYIDQAITLRR